MKKFLILLSLCLTALTHQAQEPDSDMLQKARQGDAESQNNVGLFYLRNGNEHEALKWWELAANQGYVSAQANLGEYYGIHNEYDKALKWVVPAANSGSPNAAYRLAIFYRDGKGVERNIEEALKWSLKSAEGGQKDAYLLTGNIYEKYFGDKTNATLWYKLAADNGDPKALNWFGAEMMKTGNKEAGFDYFIKAANKGYAPAQRNVALYYYNSHQYDAAKSWLRRAAGQGDEKAIELLRKPQFQ